MTLKQTHKKRNEVGAFEAKTHFSQLLAAVSLGQEFAITRHGQKIALLLPFPTSVQEYSPSLDAIRSIKKLRKGITLGKRLSIKEMRATGRK